MAGMQLGVLFVFFISVFVAISNFLPIYFLEIHHETRMLNSSTRVQWEHRRISDFLKEESEGTEISIGLLNIDEESMEKWKAVGNIRTIEFDMVAKTVKWKDLFPEWIDQDLKWKRPRCPDLPIPRSQDYGEFDVIVSGFPCEDFDKNKGSRNVLKLQIHLLTAYFSINNGRKKTRNGDSVVIVIFQSYCEPMWEIFRCEDLEWHEKNLWVFKSNYRRLKQKIQLPSGSCELAMPVIKEGNGVVRYDHSRMIDPIVSSREAYVSILHSSEDYVCGAIVLAQSILQTNSTKDLILLLDDSIKQRSRRALIDSGWKIRRIERIRSTSAKKDAYNEWNYSKLRLWELVDYDKIIFIDSDMILLRNMDDFFRYPQLSATGNDGVLFNSGVMAIEPSLCMFNMLMEKKKTVVSYNGGDQGFLNEIFTWWHRWPSKLNKLKVFVRQGSKRDIQNDTYAIHYLGLKPWNCDRAHDCNWDSIKHHHFASNMAHKKWWNVYDNMSRKLQDYCSSSSKLKIKKNSMRKTHH